MSRLRIRFDTVEFGEEDIHVRSLRNSNEYEDDGGISDALGISEAMWPLFGILWESGRVLAERMADHDIEGRRILEVGCGLGLSSLLLNRRQADVTATDQHPAAERFLDFNTDLNGDPDIPFVRIAWLDADAGMGRFDLIIGSDLLYDRDQADPLCSFIVQHAEPTCEVVLVDPGRGQLGRMTQLMAEHGFSHQAEGAPPRGDDGRARIQIHTFDRKEGDTGDGGVLGTRGAG